MARIDDGHSTIVTFAEDGAIALFEKEVTPPGVDGGGANPTTTMRNTVWRTNAPKKLKTLTDAALTVAYDPAVIDSIVAMCQINQLITVTYPDLSTLAFWGWLDTFTPNANVEGEQPTAEVNIIPSNMNGSLVETAPVFTAAP